MGDRTQVTQSSLAMPCSAPSPHIQNKPSDPALLSLALLYQVLYSPHDFVLDLGQLSTCARAEMKWCELGSELTYLSSPSC